MYGEGQVVNHPMSMPAARVRHRLVHLCTNPPTASGSAPATACYRHDGHPTGRRSTRKGPYSALAVLGGLINEYSEAA
jgi:hypothetical protein